MKQKIIRLSIPEKCMSIHMIEAVRFNVAGDRVEEVRWGRAKPKDDGSIGWEHKTSEQDVSLVVDALHFGDEVATAFSIDGKIVRGPNIALVIYEHGIEGIGITGQDAPDRTLADLPRF
jgi:hypothetical protein